MGWRQIKCKLKNHFDEGCDQRYIPDLGLDEICANCGSITHEMTKEDIIDSFTIAGFDEIEIEYVLNQMGFNE